MTFLLLLALCAACQEQAAPPIDASETPSTSATIGDRGVQSKPEAGARCEDVRRHPEQGGGHLVGSAEPPQSYNSVPPTSGWHTTGVRVDIYRRALTEAEQVGVLEGGNVVISYGPLRPRDLATLHRHVHRRHESVVAVTSYPKLKAGVVALTAWTVSQRCRGVDVKALDAFVRKYPAARPGH